MKTTAIVAAALALAGCNRALKEEQAAWARVADQKRVVMRKTAECREKVGLADLWAKLDAAEKACRPFQEAVSKTVANLNSGRRSDTDAFLAASKAQEHEPACQDANRYRKLWLQADKDAQP